MIEWLRELIANNTLNVGVFVQPDTHDSVNRSEDPGASVGHLWLVLQNTHEWIRAADMKAGVILATDGVAATLMAALGSTTCGRLTVIIPAGILMGLGLLAIVLSALWSTACLVPRLGKCRCRSPIFFADIASACAAPADYEVMVGDVIEDVSKLKAELCSQILANSCVASEKFAAVNKATVALMLAIALLVVSGVVAWLIGVL